MRRMGKPDTITLISEMFINRRPQMSKEGDYNATIRRYEDCRRRWNGRCNSILKQSPASVPALKILLKPDDVLDALDEELVRLERQLPHWYVSDAEW